MQTIRLFLAVVTFTAIFAVQASAHTVITQTTDGRAVTMEELASRASAADVVLVGESHNEKYHHDLQLDLVRALSSSKAPVSIGLEMIQSDHQEALDRWVAGQMPEAEMQEVFERNWSDWPMYRDIFVYARDNRIPLVALNVPIHIVRKVSRHGFASLTPKEKKDLPEGTTCDLKNPQIAFLRTMFKAVENHAMNGRMFSNFCEAQTVRNSGMAVNLERYAKRQPGRKVVVLTGIWHAVKYAVPDQLQRLGSRLSTMVILPETPALDKTNAGPNEADYLVEL